MESRKRTDVDVSPVDVSPDREQIVTARPGTYAPFNRGDMTAAVKALDAQFEWAEPGGLAAARIMGEMAWNSI